MRAHQLIGSAGLVLGACYSPELQDCTVTCSISTDCADDQVCGGDKFCASPEVANQCESAGTGSSMTTVTLRITVEGSGKVVVKDIGECAAHDDTIGDCTWQLAIGTRVELEASSGDFDKWLSPACSGQDKSCTFTPETSTIVGAKFRSGRED